MTNMCPSKSAGEHWRPSSLAVPTIAMNENETPREIRKHQASLSADTYGNMNATSYSPGTGVGAGAGSLGLTPLHRRVESPPTHTVADETYTRNKQLLTSFYQIHDQ